MVDKVITIIGPTASGKTSLAVNLSKKINAEVISLDSRQIYRGMTIGTAQPSNVEMNGVKHHLIGIKDPSLSVSAGEYAKLVVDKVKDIKSKGRLPIICGGAGLYYRAICYGIFRGSRSDLNIRDRLEKLYNIDSPKLMRRLCAVDPEYAAKTHINNKKRLIRSLEIFEITGKTPTENFKNQESDPTSNLDLFTVRIHRDRNILNKRIEKRLDFMLASGWIKEVELLLIKQSNEQRIFPALDSIGYSQIKSYLKKEISYNLMREKILIKTRQFAKRQEKWFDTESIDLTVDMGHMKSQLISEIIHCLLKDIT